MSLYNIAGLTVQSDFRFDIMKKRAEKYLCSQDSEPDIAVNVSPGLWEDAKAEYPYISDDELELIITGFVFYAKLLDFNGFMLHSSAVELDGKAYLFSAPSGTGKSTHTEQWLRLFGTRAGIINDDKPALRYLDGIFYACGTPWSGKNDISANICVPIQGICMLERSPHNFIEPLSPERAVFDLMNQTVRIPDEGCMDKLMTLLDHVIGNVPLWHMGCNISAEAAEMAYKAMCKKQKWHEGALECSEIFMK